MFSNKRNWNQFLSYIPNTRYHFQKCQFSSTLSWSNCHLHRMVLFFPPRKTIAIQHQKHFSLFLSLYLSLPHKANTHTHAQEKEICIAKNICLHWIWPRFASSFSKYPCAERTTTTTTTAASESGNHKKINHA